MADPMDVNVGQIVDDISNALNQVHWQTWGAAILYILIGFTFAGLASGFVGRILNKHTSAHYTMIIRRMVYYGLITISVILALAAVHLDMKVLGLATVLTLGLGFAAQSAVANIISGLFLVFEQPFVVGDIIEYKGMTGELLSIDLLSIKVLTGDNSQVRIPNEELLKNQFINLTRFETRRLEIQLFISMYEDLEKVSQVLIQIALKNKFTLKKPPPKLLFDKFNESAMIFKLAIWVNKESYDDLKHSVAFEIQQAFKANNFKVPVTQFLQLN